MGVAGPTLPHGAGLTAEDWEVVRSCRLFKGLEASVLATVTEVGHARKVARGHRLVEPEQPWLHVLVVLEGELGAYLDHSLQVSVARFVRGDCVGENAVLGDGASSLYVVAQLPTRVLAVEAGAFRALMEHAPRIALNLLEILSARLAKSNTNRLRAELPKQEFERLATHDPLTGLNNRRWMNENFARELRQAREQRPAALLVIDIDYFEAVNDALGHAGGDLLLRAIGEAIRRCFRPGDLSARMSGDRFGVLLPNTELAKARDAAERLRAQVAAHPMPIRNGVTSTCTVSIGLSETIAGELEPTLAAATAALQQAKDAGRNRVTTFSVSGGSTSSQ